MLMSISRSCSSTRQCRGSNSERNMKRQTSRSRPVTLRMRKVTGLEREVWRFMFRSLFEPRHWRVLEQDREMLINMPSDARKREMLYQHDVGVSRIRQVLVAKA